MREKKTRRFFAMDQNRRGRLRRANVGGSDDWNLASAKKRKNTGIAFARWVRGEARVLDASGTARVSSRVATPRVRASLYLVAGTRARAPSPRVALVLCGVRVPTAPGAALAFPARDDGGTFFMCCSACSAISSSAFPRGDCTGGC